MGASHRSAVLAGALLAPLHSIVAPFRGSAAELLGGDPARLHPLAESRKLAHVGAEGISHAAHIRRADVVRVARFRLFHMDRSERIVPVGVCALLVAAAALSSLPTVGTAAGGAAPTYGTRVVIDGLNWNQDTTSYYVPGPTSGPAGSGLDFSYSGDGTISNVLAGPEVAASGTGQFTVYRVQSGDNLQRIAAKFDIRVPTLYWANKAILPDPETIYPGQRLTIPPSDGLIVTVTATDTVDSLAAKYEMTAQDVMDANHLTGPNIVTGQKLFIPGASGGPMPTPKIPTSTTGGGGSSGGGGGGGGSTSCRTCGGGTYAGGTFKWPVVGGHNYVSQYYWYGHRALDIAAAYGSSVVAAASGTVVYAGWMSYTMGGNVIWVSDGSNLYTTYNHLSYVGVVAGQTISAGQAIGRIGLTGITTGPHLHFEVWIGYPWANHTNGNAVNPCAYLAGC